MTARYPPISPRWTRHPGPHLHPERPGGTFVRNVQNQTEESNMKAPKKTVRKKPRKTVETDAAIARPYPSGELPASVARESFSETLNRVTYRKERVVIRRHGRGIAAVVPMEDYEILERLQDQAD